MGIRLEVGLIVQIMCSPNSNMVNYSPLKELLVDCQSPLGQQLVFYSYKFLLSIFCHTLQPGLACTVSLVVINVAFSKLFLKYYISDKRLCSTTFPILRRELKYWSVFLTNFEVFASVEQTLP